MSFESDHTSAARLRTAGDEQRHIGCFAGERCEPPRELAGGEGLAALIEQHDALAVAQRRKHAFTLTTHRIRRTTRAAGRQLEGDEFQPPGRTDTAQVTLRCGIDPFGLTGTDCQDA